MPLGEGVGWLLVGLGVGRGSECLVGVGGAVGEGLGAVCFHSETASVCEVRLWLSCVGFGGTGQWRQGVRLRRSICR